MKMIGVVNFGLTALFCMLFIWQAWTTIYKYRSEKTNLQVKVSYLSILIFQSCYVCVNDHFVQITLHDNGHILFPSITFCKFFMFIDNGVLYKENIFDLPTSHRRKSFVDRTWSRDQLFRTVSHNTIDGTYASPCTTVRGPKMGSPCTFPFIYPDCSESFKFLYNKTSLKSLRLRKLLD